MRSGGWRSRKDEGTRGTMVSIVERLHRRMVTVACVVPLVGLAIAMTIHAAVGAAAAEGTAAAGVSAQETPEAVVTPVAAKGEASEKVRGMLVLGAAIVMAAAVLGAGYAVGHVGSAALGAASERPEMLARSLVFVALAEGIAVWGLIVAVLLLGKM